MLYKPSQYNCIKVAEKVAIFNTFSGSMAIMECEEYSKLQHIDELCAEDEDVQRWLRLDFIVEADKDEAAIVNYCRYRDTFLKNRPIYRILTTSACNARCFYCYEQGRPIQNMSKETAVDAADFIMRSSEDAEKIALNWFGGEPLLNPDVITLIMQKLNVTMGKEKVASSMITNASLFSKELIDLAKEEWNLTNIQITLDGMAETHEKRKAYVNNEYYFNKTIETIGSLLSAGFHVSLRLNYDKKNFSNIIVLIHFIHKIFGNPSNLSCYAYPLFNTSSRNEAAYVYDKDIPEYIPRILHALTECGYYNPMNILPRLTTACFATDPYSYVINTDGLLYKCTMDGMEPSRSVGNVWDGVQMNNRIIEWTTPVLIEQCHECKMLPICQGGCRASHMLNIDMNGCEIKKQLIEYTLNHLLKTETL